MRSGTASWSPVTPTSASSCAATANSACAASRNTLSYEIVQAQNPNLTLLTSANPISEGQSVTLTGKVAGASNAAVTLFGHTAASPWGVLASAKTNASGEYTFTQSPASNTFYRCSPARSTRPSCSRASKTS